MIIIRFEDFMSTKMNKCETCPSQGKGIFCELEHMELQDVTDHKINNSYKKGQVLFVEGNPTFGIYCVSSGNIKITQMSADGKESIIRIASAGDVIGHRSLFTQKHYQATATALENAHVCFIYKDYILKLISEKPSVSFNLISRLSRDLGAAEHRISSFYQKNVRERLAELLLLLKESHGEETDQGTFINIKLTRDEMASIIGTAPETLIRFMSEIKSLGYIHQEGKKIFITDEKALLEFAGIEY